MKLKNEYFTLEECKNKKNIWYIVLFNIISFLIALKVIKSEKRTLNTVIILGIAIFTGILMICSVFNIFLWLIR